MPSLRGGLRAACRAASPHSPSSFVLRSAPARHSGPHCGAGRAPGRQWLPLRGWGSRTRHGLATSREIAGPCGGPVKSSRSMLRCPQKPGILASSGDGSLPPAGTSRASRLASVTSRAGPPWGCCQSSPEARRRRGLRKKIGCGVSAGTGRERVASRGGGTSQAGRAGAGWRGGAASSGLRGGGCHRFCRRGSVARVTGSAALGRRRWEAGANAPLPVQRSCSAFAGDHRRRPADAGRRGSLAAPDPRWRRGWSMSHRLF
jgi:hypothetical protein